MAYEPVDMDTIMQEDPDEVYERERAEAKRRITKREREALKDVVEKKTGPTIDVAHIKQQIYKYYKYWPNLKPDTAIRAGAKPEAWQKELDRLKIEKGSEMELATAKQLHILFCTGIEWFASNIFNPTPFSFQGLGMTMALSPPFVTKLDIEDELKELTIKYPSLFSTGPELRLLYKIFQVVQEINTLTPEKVKQNISNLDKLPTKNLNKEYSDL